MDTATTLVFVAVVGARFLLPLAIPYYPLPAIVACLILDGVDQTIFQAFGHDPPGYQSYDKAMDVFYLSMAYLSTLRNWESMPAFRIGWFLYFYRLVGALALRADPRPVRCCWSSRTSSSTSSSPTRRSARAGGRSTCWSAGGSARPA